MDRRALLCGICLLPVAFARAEDLVPYRRLAWSDFRVDPQQTGTMSAATEGRIKYDFQWEWVQRGETVTVRLTRLTVESFFDREASWRKQDLGTAPALLLEHEQGHLDIVHSAALALKRLTPADFGTESATDLTTARDRLLTRARRVFDDALVATRRRQTQYDMETRHGRERDAQARWSALLREEIAEGTRKLRATPGAG